MYIIYNIERFDVELLNLQKKSQIVHIKNYLKIFA